jgi:hypothetical protein
MDGINKLDLFVAWTPLAVMALAVVLLFLLAVAVIVYGNRAAISAWFAARWVEQSSAQARKIAVGSSLLYVGSRIGIPTVDPVSLTLVAGAWLYAIRKFVLPDPAAPAASAPAQEGQ